MGKKLDLKGKRFGSLLVKYATGEKHTNGSFIWRCECDCGNEVDLPSRTLVHDGRKNCGCYGRKLANHGYYDTPTYQSWQNMCARCRKSVKYYEDVVLCERWDTTKGGGFENFFGRHGRASGRRNIKQD